MKRNPYTLGLRISAGVLLVIAMLYGAATNTSNFRTPMGDTVDPTTVADLAMLSLGLAVFAFALSLVIAGVAWELRSRDVQGAHRGDRAQASTRG